MEASSAEYVGFEGSNRQLKINELTFNSQNLWGQTIWDIHEVHSLYENHKRQRWVQGASKILKREKSLSGQGYSVCLVHLHPPIGKPSPQISTSSC